MEKYGVEDVDAERSLLKAKKDEVSNKTKKVLGAAPITNKDDDNNLVPEKGEE